MHSQAPPASRPNPLEHVAANLRRLRQQQGVSQEALAAASGLSRRMINAIENSAANASLATVDRLGAALGVPFTTLVRSPAAKDNSRLEILGWTGKHRSSRAVLLGSAPTANETEIWSWSLAPGETFASEEIAHSWHEAIIVLEGAVTLRCGQDDDVVTEGDFRIFTKHEPYEFRNDGSAVARYLRLLML